MSTRPLVDWCGMGIGWLEKDRGMGRGGVWNGRGEVYRMYVAHRSRATGTLQVTQVQGESPDEGNSKQPPQKCISLC